MQITTRRTGPGQFDVLVDGQPNGWQIVNGSLGTSGRDTPNMYGIAIPGRKVKWVGPLKTAKALVKLWIDKSLLAPIDAAIDALARV
ncbi:MAG: hypothetical protein FJ271_27425 [Planctomycetes bacterium]|nr:hypothetical protein [Planctomycetota bacterium]